MLRAGPADIPSGTECWSVHICVNESRGASIGTSPSRTQSQDSRASAPEEASARCLLGGCLLRCVSPARHVASRFEARLAERARSDLHKKGKVWSSNVDLRPLQRSCSKGGTRKGPKETLQAGL